MVRDGFVFYRSFYEAIRELPRDVQGEIYTAIVEYGLYGKETERLKPIARSIFALVKPQLDANTARYVNGKLGAESGKLGAEYGKLGGRPKSENPPKTPLKPPKNPPKEKDKVKVKEKVKDLKDIVQPEDKNLPVESVNQGEMWFEMFWRAYPKHQDRKKAEQRFKRVCTSERKFREIMDGLERNLPVWAGRDKKYIPLPTTWLNGERWNDEINTETGFLNHFEEDPF